MILPTGVKNPGSLEEWITGSSLLQHFSRKRAESSVSGRKNADLLLCLSLSPAPGRIIVSFLQHKYRRCHATFLGWVRGQAGRCPLLLDKGEDFMEIFMLLAREDCWREFYLDRRSHPAFLQPLELREALLSCWHTVRIPEPSREEEG